MLPPGGQGAAWESGRPRRCVLRSRWAEADELFAAEGHATDTHLLLGNVEKCRPPGNRAPHPEETAGCQPLLERQLALSPARFTVLMGSTAMRHLAPEREPFSAHASRFSLLPERPGTGVLRAAPPAVASPQPVAGAARARARPGAGGASRNGKPERAPGQRSPRTSNRRSPDGNGYGHTGPALRFRRRPAAPRYGSERTNSPLYMSLTITVPDGR